MARFLKGKRTKFIDIMSKFQVGQRVHLFNSLSLVIEEDEVYGIVYVPVAKEGVEQISGKPVSEKLKDGEVEVHEQYQLCGHQGVLEADCLFATEDECREFYRKFFS